MTPGMVRLLYAAPVVVAACAAAIALAAERRRQIAYAKGYINGVRRRLGGRSGSVLPFEKP